MSVPSALGPVLPHNHALRFVRDLRDAACADVLITQDENFRAVAGMARTGLKILSLNEFARHLLAQASALQI